jgi:YD repeat-containing protein
MRFVYGGQGQLIAVVDPTGRAVTFDYYRTTAGEGFEGCVHTVTDFDNRVVTYKYDSSGRLTNVSGPDPESPNSAKPSTTYTWGSAATVGNKQQLYTSGQMADEKDGKNRTVWSAGYDSSNPWAAKTLTSGGGSWTITPAADKTTVLDPNSHTWEYGRDADRHINSLKEPGGPTTSYGYDNDGRLASVTRPLGDKTTYGYDSAAGNDRRPMLNVKTATEYPRAGSDEATASMTRVTTIGYGPANLPVSIATPDGANTLIPRDPRGNPRSITDAANVTTTPVYDEHGLLKSSSDPRTGNVIYGYLPGSQSGYLNTITTSAGTVTYKPDARGNITQIIDPSNRIVTYTLNKLGQVEIESKGDESTLMSYDATGELITKKVLVGVDASGQPIFRQMTFDVDEVGRLHHRTDDAQATTIGYDAKGNIASFTRTGKPPATFGYDARDRFTTEIVGTQTTTYGYDDNSTLASLTNARNKKTIYAQSGFGDSRGTTNAISVMTAQTTTPRAVR